MNYDPTGRIPTQHNERGNDMPSPTPEELFTDTHNRYMKNWTVIISLRQFVDASAPYELRAFMEAQLTQGVMTSAHAAIDAQYT